MTDLCTISIPLDSARELRDLLGRLREQTRGLVEVETEDYVSLVCVHGEMKARVEMAEEEALANV